MGSFGGRMQHWGRLAIRNPWAFLTTLVAGAAFAFAYSYVPLHSVKNRKIASLEQRVISQEEEVDGLARQLRDAQVSAEERPDRSVLASLEDERTSLESELEHAKKELAKSKTRVGRLEAERSEWKRKIALLEAKLESGSLASANRSPAESVRDPAPVPPAAGDAGAAGGADATASRAMAGSAPPAPSGPAGAPGTLGPDDVPAAPEI